MADQRNLPPTPPPAEGPQAPPNIFDLAGAGSPPPPASAPPSSQEQAQGPNPVLIFRQVVMLLQILVRYFPELMPAVRRFLEEVQDIAAERSGVKKGRKRRKKTATEEE